jgi:hypothetical protein
MRDPEAVGAFGASSFAQLDDPSGTTSPSDPLASRLVAALGDDPQLLAAVLGKLL